MREKMTSRQPKRTKSTKILCCASLPVGASLAGAIFAVIPSTQSRADFVYYQQTPAADPTNWYAANWTDNSGGPAYGQLLPNPVGSSSINIDINTGNTGNTYGGVVFDPANQLPNGLSDPNSSFTIAGKLYISSSNVGPGSANAAVNYGGLSCVPNFLTIASGTLTISDSTNSNSFILVGRSVNGTLNQTGGNFNVDATVQLGQLSGTNGNGTYNFSGGNLSAGFGASPGTSPGIRLGGAAGSSGTMVINNTLPGQIKTAGYYSAFSKGAGSYGLTEFHYGNGNVRTVQNTGQLSIRNEINPDTYASELSLVLDAAPTMDADQTPQNLGLFHDGSITNGGATADAVFWGPDRLTSYLDRSSTYTQSYPTNGAGRNDNVVFTSSFGGRTYVWDITYTGNIALDNNGNVTSMTGHGTGQDVVLTGRSSYVGSLWASQANDNWSASGNWSGNAVPNAVDAGANFFNFTPAAVGPVVIGVDIPVTLGSLKFDNSSRYTLEAGGGSITMQTSSGNAFIQLISGSHTVHAPMVLNSNTRVTVGANHDLTMGGPLSGNGNINKNGEGLLTLTSNSNTNYTGSIQLNAGTINVNGITTVRSIQQTGGTLNINGTGVLHVLANNRSAASTSVLSAVPFIDASAQLDVEDNAVAVKYDASDTTHSTREAIRNLLKNGRNAGPASAAPWNGLGGIVSTYAHNVGNGFNLAIGYADNTDLAAVRASGSYTVFGGQTVASNTVLVQLTRGADATLDGVVDGQDVAIIGTHFQKPGSGQWCFGDFDYSGTCDGSDVAVLGTTFGKTSPVLSPAQMTAEFGAAFTAAFEAGQSGAVPEPGSLMLLGLGAAAMMGGRRRRKGR